MKFSKMLALVGLALALAFGGASAQQAITLPTGTLSATVANIADTTHQDTLGYTLGANGVAPTLEFTSTDGKGYAYILTLDPAVQVAGAVGPYTIIYSDLDAGAEVTAVTPNGALPTGKYKVEFVDAAVRYEIHAEVEVDNDIFDCAETADGSGNHPCAVNRDYIAAAENAEEDRDNMTIATIVLGSALGVSLFALAYMARNGKGAGSGAIQI